jgi:hypothetical protein
MNNAELFNFEWNEEKAILNLLKHKVDFEEAVSVFSDPYSLTIYDQEHSQTENRFIDVGASDKGRILVVVYAERGDRIRIISCRKATKKEKAAYEKLNS